METLPADTLQNHSRNFAHISADLDSHTNKLHGGAVYQFNGVLYSTRSNGLCVRYAQTSIDERTSRAHGVRGHHASAPLSCAEAPSTPKGRAAARSKRSEER